MSERLFAVALAASVLGLVLIAYASKHVDPPYSRIRDISVSSLEKNVRFTGYVSSVHRFKGGSVMLEVVEDGSTIDVYIPNRIAAQLELVRGKRVDVTGRIQLYEGRLEVVVDEADWIKRD
jgi:DNA/RNA endonuclease YhcR with UshA esterase domain